MVLVRKEGVSAWLKRVVFAASCLYLAALLALWAGIVWERGEWWPITLFLFAPRWVVALPLLLLVPATLLTWGRSLVVYVVHGLVIVFPLLGFELPSAKTTTRAADATLRVMSYNLGEGSIDETDVARFIEAHDIDVALFQECPSPKAQKILSQVDWQYRISGNIVIASRYPLGEAIAISRHPGSQFHAIVAVGCQLEWPEAAQQPMWLVSTHLPTFRPALEYAERFDSVAGTAINNMGREYLEIARRLGDAVNALPGAVVVGGDFNIPVESYYYQSLWDDWHNAYSRAGSGLGHTKYTRFHGIRIDHVLYNSGWSASRAEVGPGLGGDHRPVITDLRWAPSGS